MLNLQDNILGCAAGTLLVLLGLVSWFDLRHMLIPNVLTFCLLLGGIIFAASTAFPDLSSSLIGAILGGSLFALISTGFHRIKGYEGLGFGDVKFLAGAGAWVGWQGVSPLIFIAAVSALAFAGARSLAGYPFHGRTRIPFGPFLSCATLIVWIAQISGYAPWISE